MREAAGTPRRAAALLVVPVLALAGCGGDDEVGAKPDLPTETPALWNPCDALGVGFVKKQFGTDATKDAGTEQSPECRFTPKDPEGDEPALTSSYLLFSGTLDEAWKTMQVGNGTEVTEPAIAGADDARVVVNATKDQLYVTGFVQNGGLIQQVDVVDPKPYDEQRIVRGVEATLARLSQHAEASDVRGEGS
ncbi:hypothetical protein ACFQ0K_09485 [Nocardioides caeni]|uniref:DUF3558 domain-containing protein n=1 Tax=Nocardioides caeni TaxID=574700 RepID=A0A4S8MZN4_9ACTN|nr:hypothetical protein [Nocardioides caeni]THV08950.1 hypothetical protein E9934_18225 [Nocardioides caeni]